MADVPKIDVQTDTLRTGLPKINAAIDSANQALSKATTAETNSTTALTNANQAKQTAEVTQTQLDQVTGASTIDPAVEQIKVDTEGVIHASPDARIRSDYNKVTSQLAQISYLMSSFPRQGTETNDIARIKRAITKLQEKGGGVLKFERMEYYIPVLSELDTISVPSNIKIDFDEATLKVGEGQNGQTYYFTFLINGAENAELRNAKFVWQGSFDSTINTVTQYGITAKQHSFNTIIALNGSHKNVVIENISCVGETDVNTYDALLRSFSLSGENLQTRNIFASHYGNLISDGIRNATIENIRGTKRHNLTSLVYGPSHMIYAALNNCVVRNIEEYGEILDNTNYDLGATIQTTELVNSKIENVRTTMRDAGSVVMKNIAESSYINDIICKPIGWNTNIHKHVFMFGINTNETKVKKLHIDNVFSDVKNFNVTGVWLGGNDITAENIDVEISDANAVQTVPPLAVVTANDSIVDAKVKNASVNSAPLAFISGANRNRIDVIKKGLFSIVKYYAHPTTSSNWGVSTSNRVKVQELDYTEGDISASYVNNNERDSNIFLNENPYEQAMKFVEATGTNVASLTLDAPIDMPQYATSSYISRNIMYELDVSALDAEMDNALVRRYLCMATDGFSVKNQIVLSQIAGDLKVGTGTINLSYTVDGANKKITFTATITGGNLDRLSAKVKMINKQLWR